MKVYVKQDKITFFGRRYVVFMGRKKVLVIRRLWMTPIPKFKITEYATGKELGTMENKFLSFRGNANISLPNGTFKFDQKSINSMRYECRSLVDSPTQYLLQGNKGFSGSIYKDNHQIGQWNKNQFVIFNGDAYELDLDFDADIPLIASMMVLIDTYRISIKIGGDIGWEVGNIGKG